MTLQFLRFAAVGTLGFVVDAGCLYLALAFGFGYYSGRVFSFLAAVLVTWQINRRFTFAVRAGEPLHVEGLRYLMAMLGGGAVNYGCYAATVYLLPKTAWLPLLAVAVGSVAGLAVNFLTAKFWVFRQRDPRAVG